MSSFHKRLGYGLLALCASLTFDVSSADGQIFRRWRGYYYSPPVYSYSYPSGYFYSGPVYTYSAPGYSMSPMVTYAPSYGYSSYAYPSYAYPSYGYASSYEYPSSGYASGYSSPSYSSSGYSSSGYSSSGSASSSGYGTSSPSYAADQGPAQSTVVKVSAYEYTYNPSVLRIKPGTTVEWVNTGHHGHTVTSEDRRWDSGDLKPGQTFRMTFVHPGTYYYYCTHHARENMRGSIIVGSSEGGGGYSTPGRSGY
jgi:plastocyanin